MRWQIEELNNSYIIFHFCNCVEYLSVLNGGQDGALMVELHKTSAGLGFSLDGGKSSSHGDRPLTVKRIFKGEISSISLIESQ